MVALAGVLVLAGAIAVSVAAVRGSSSPKRHVVSTTTAPTTTTTAPGPTWRVAWGSAMAWGYGTAQDTTVRDLATVAVGGSEIRIRLSNLFGNAPLEVGAVTVAPSDGGPNLDAAALQTVTFSGAPGVTIPVGQVVTSDPVALPVTDEETLAISVYASSKDLVTLHYCCAAVRAYSAANNAGNLTDSPTGKGFVIADGYERWVDAVDVLESTGEGSIVVLGDSITDGFNSTTNWVNVLQQRIDTLPASEQRAVVNEGITANALTSVVHTDSAVGGGPSGLSRLDMDVFDQPGVSEMVMFLGTNDLWFGASANEVIEGYEQAIAAAHAAGIRIVAVTLLPRASNPREPWTGADQAQLEQVDNWIRTSGAFDGVIDLAPVVADVYNGACSPNILFPPYDSGDHLHPNPAGDTAMGNAIEGAVLELPALPIVPPLVQVTPTATCAAAAGAPAPAPPSTTTTSTPTTTSTSSTTSTTS